MGARQTNPSTSVHPAGCSWFGTNWIGRILTLRSFVDPCPFHPGRRGRRSGGLPPKTAKSRTAQVRCLRRVNDVGGPVETDCGRSDLAGECRPEPIPGIGRFVRRQSAVPWNLTFSGGTRRRVTDSATRSCQRLLPWRANWRYRPKAAGRPATVRTLSPIEPRKDGLPAPPSSDHIRRPNRARTKQYWRRSEGRRGDR